MQKATEITCVFVDIGGAPLTDGWDHCARKRAAANCKLEWKKMEDRHRLVFNAMEEGNFTLPEYLSLVVFDKARPFTQAQFRRLAQSSPYPEMIELISQLRARQRRKIAVVNNEAARTDCLSDSKVQTRSTVASLFPPASSACANRSGHFPGLPLVWCDHRLVRSPISKTPVFIEIAEGLGFEAFSTRIAFPHATSWLHWDCRAPNGHR